METGGIYERDIPDKRTSGISPAEVEKCMDELLAQYPGLKKSDHTAGLHPLLLLRRGTYPGPL